MAISKGAISKAQFEAASQAGRSTFEAGHAVAAKFIENRKRLSVTLNTGVEILVPVDRIQDLAGADPEKLKTVEIAGAGLGLYFPELDADVYVPSLMSGIFGTKDWMAKILGAQGGAARTQAKAAAARENGKNGGRPKNGISANRSIAKAAKSATEKVVARASERFSGQSLARKVRIIDGAAASGKAVTKKKSAKRA